jgi:F-type H+-transporting ATPase subunit alpha
VVVATNGFLDAIPVEHLKRYETEFLDFMENAHKPVLMSIIEIKDLNDAVKVPLLAAIKQFTERFMTTIH